jgi:iron complex transport system ATP-binding protein
MIDVIRASGGYSNHPILKDISFEVKKGELLGIIGPNGSGKTTLLKMISGILPVQKGEITIKGKTISAYSTKDFAKLTAVLPQHTSQTFGYTVKETVSLGRYAHQSGWFQSFSKEDEKIVQEVMEMTRVQNYQDFLLDELSGGERQRVFLAQALAQKPEILLLDEPTNHLDLSYQKELLDLLKKWTNEKGLTVVSIFHDLNLAGLYCDKLLLLHKGKMEIQHYPNEVLKEERIQSVYRTKIEKYPHPKVPKPQMMFVPEGQNSDVVDCGIHEGLLRVSKEMITLESKVLIRTMSSGVTGSGLGWYRTFVNRHVGKDYHCQDHKREMAEYLKIKEFDPNETVGMMTAVQLEDVSYQFFEEDSFSTLIVVTAGVSNAVDATNGERSAFIPSPGTINIWVFVNGELTEEAFIQCIMTATEAKVKALQERSILDPLSGTLATGTSTDSILIAATQKGMVLPFGGTITPLGRLIGKGVYQCTKQALTNYFKRIQTK